eukprot:scaffold31678_cov58-Attheya_sp.AAC.3
MPPNANNDDVVYIGRSQHNQSQAIRLHSVQADTQAVWKLCLRNMAVPDDRGWGIVCLCNDPTMRNCRNEETAQLLEMAMFDAIIRNWDRLHMPGGGLSNNVHWLWPTDSEPYLNPEAKDCGLTFDRNVAASLQLGIP